MLYPVLIRNVCNVRSPRSKKTKTLTQQQHAARSSRSAAFTSITVSFMSMITSTNTATKSESLKLIIEVSTASHPQCCSMTVTSVCVTGITKRQSFLGLQEVWQLPHRVDRALCCRLGLTRVLSSQPSCIEALDLPSLLGPLYILRRHHNTT